MDFYKALKNRIKAAGKTRSIFEKIEEEINKNGILPADFEAEERAYADDELRFAPGAMEGILVHHSCGSQELKGFMEKLEEYLSLPEPTAMLFFENKTAKNIKIATIRYEIIKTILANKEKYDPEKIYNMAYYFAKNGTKCETVKLGLTLLTLFNLSEDKDVCYLLKNLGYCEEFTEYVLINTSVWEKEKQQNFYFELAQKLSGWGKISIVEDLLIDTEEKKQWLLCHGCKNSIAYAYLARICAQKSGLYERLKKGNLTEEEFAGASDIIEGLLDEGPCEGMSKLDNAAELTMLYLEESKQHRVDVDYVARFCAIVSYFRMEGKEIQGADLVDEKASEILQSIDVDGLITNNLAKQTYQCITIANVLDIDITDRLFSLMERDFSKYYNFAYCLFVRKKYIEEFFTLCDNEISAEKYPRGMGNSLGLGNLGEGILSLDMIVQHLDAYPLKGKKLIAISINSPITRWRNMAARALLGWTEKLGKPLSQIDTELYQMVSNVAKIECNEKTKASWEKLLEE